MRRTASWASSRHYLLRRGWLLARLFRAMGQLFFSLLSFANGERCADESDMCKCLRKVAQRISGSRLNLLGIQTQVIAIRHQAPKQRVGSGQRAAAKSLVFGFPETTDRECAFRRIGAVAVQQSIGGAQVLQDGAIGAPHAGRIGFFKSVPREQKQAGVQLIAVEDADVALQLWIPSPLLNLALN